jgi:hypothetical protein
MPVKKKRRKSDADAVARPVKKKTRRTEIQEGDGELEIVSSGPTHKSRVAFRDLKMVIADTLQSTMQFGSNDVRGNAEELAHWIAYSIMYDDGGFKIREQSYELPRHSDC